MKNAIFTGIILAYLSSQAAWADCFIKEYRTLEIDAAGRVLPVASDEVADQKVTTSGTSAQSVAFNAETRMVRIICAQKTHFVKGSNPTATTSNSYIPADLVEYQGVRPSDKIAFINGV